jgi:hypothetical protein
MIVECLFTLQAITSNMLSPMGKYMCFILYLQKCKPCVYISCACLLRRKLNISKILFISFIMVFKVIFFEVPVRFK